MKPILALILLACSIQAANFTVPFVKNPPQIDGVLNPAEWNEALAISGANPTRLDHRKTTVYLAFDKNHLYLAVIAEAPPRGKLKASPRENENPVLDDSLEVWFQPPTQNRTIEQHKFGYFQFITNSIGKTYANHHDPGYGLPAKPWKNSLLAKHTITDGNWHAELRFNASDFGFDSFSDDQWKILLVRNFRTQPGYQAPMTDVNGFMDHKSYSTFQFNSNAPAIQQLYSEIRFPGTFVNNSNTPCKLQGTITADNATTEIDLPLNANANCDITSKLPINSSFNAKLNVLDQQGKQIWNRTINWKPKSDRIWFNLESFAMLEHSFNKPLETKPDFAANDDISILFNPKGTYEPTAGRTKDTNALKLTTGTLAFNNAKFQIPGSVSFWVRTEAKNSKNYRRFISSEFKPSGYIFLQEQKGGYLILGAHSFKGHKQQNLVIHRLPKLGEWTHFAINFNEKQYELYMDGLKVGEQTHGIQIESENLGNILLGNSDQRDFAVANLAVYQRTLTDSEIKVLAQGDSPVSGDILWYQSINSIVLDINADFEDEQNKHLTLKIIDNQGNEVETFQVNMDEGTKLETDNGTIAVLHKIIKPSKPLADGTYELSLLNAKSNATLLKRQIQAEQFEWLGNNLGKSRRILPPFTKIERQGDDLSCILRKYHLQPGGFPRQITSLDTPILAEPIELVATKNGTSIPWTTTPVQYLPSDGISQQFTSSLTSPCLDIDLTGELEQDGLIRYDLTLKPTDNPPDRFYLDIVLKKDIAILYHPVGEGLRSNPGGFIPEGNGLVWGSRSLQQTNISNFIPYAWLGDDQRGVAFAADWDKNWIISPDRDAIEYHRKDNGDIILRINFFNEPRKAGKPRLITFALMASPVKPMPQGWRGWNDQFTTKGTRISRCLYSPPYWGAYSSWGSRYPAFKDFNYLERLIEALNTGKVDDNYLNQWVEKLLEQPPEQFPFLPKGDFRKQYALNHARAGFRIAQSLHHVKEKATIYPYTCNADSAHALPEFPVMKDEWKNGYHVYDSYADYAIFYLDKMLEIGFNGIYDDNVFFKATFNWATNNAYVDESTGKIHPSFGLWRIREYTKRQLTLMVERGLPNPWITVHHTNTNVLPTLSFATNSMGMEWKYGANDFQERFTPDYIRTVCHGRQGGFFPTVLDGINNAKENRTWVTRTMLATLLPHEVKPTAQRGSDAKTIQKTLGTIADFEPWADDCIAHNYWQNDYPLDIDNKNILSVAYRKSNNLLIIFANNGTDTPNATATFKKHRFLNAINAETNQPIECKDGTLHLNIKPHDFIIVKATID